MACVDTDTFPPERIRRRFVPTGPGKLNLGGEEVAMVCKIRELEFFTGLTQNSKDQLLKVLLSSVTVVR